MNQLDFFEQSAVDAAVKGDWKQAIEINKKIVQMDKLNLAAYLRLGFSYLQTNELGNARKSYQKALKIQPGNSVASENMERIQILDTKANKKTVTALLIDPNLFLEVPGKTKTVTLVNLGQKNILASLTTGQQVFLSIKRRKVEMRNASQDYIGNLPDDLSRRLLLFLKAKSEYVAFIKEAGVNKVTVFIKEDKKGKTVAHYLSFPSNIQAQVKPIGSDEGETHTHEDDDNEDVLVHDLEKMAENLGTEEKEYMPYETEEREVEDDE